jgi:ribosome-binding factor A
MTTPSRIDRLNSLIHEEVAEIIDNRLTNPNIKSVTVTRVKISKDIKYADIYIMVDSDEQVTARTLSALNRSKGFVQKLLAARIIIKQIPTLRFHLDKGYNSALRVYELLREIGDADHKPEG